MPENYEKPAKPLGRKAYGSIGHLPNSRLGPSDSSVHEGQGRICLEKARDKHDRIIVTEKLDGGNVAVAQVDGKIWALGRAGFPAISSPYEQHHRFHEWVMNRENLFYEMLNDGDALHGEWLIQAHGTIYILPHAPFASFDSTTKGKRWLHDDHVSRCNQFGIVTPRIIHDGGACSMETVLSAIETSGHGVAPGDTVEGAVWRVERKGAFDFMAKWVRPDKIDGKYLPEISGNPAIFNTLQKWD